MTFITPQTFTSKLAPYALVSDPFDDSKLAESGVIDDNVDTPVTLVGDLERPLDRTFVGDIEW